MLSHELAKFLCRHIVESCERVGHGDGDRISRDNDHRGRDVMGIHIYFDFKSFPFKIVSGFQ